jgi:hypothetical protein
MGLKAVSFQLMSGKTTDSKRISVRFATMVGNMWKPTKPGQYAGKQGSLRAKKVDDECG